MNSFKLPLSKDLRHKSGIYLLKINKHLYVGSSIDLKLRLQEHFSKLKQGKHQNKYMQSRYDKFSIEDCTYCILEICDSEVRLFKERDWINKLQPDLNSKIDPVTQLNSITQSKIVYQYSLNGDYITKHASCSEAARVLNIDSTSISAACRGNGNYKSAGKFLWSYKKEEKLIYVNNSKLSRIRQVTMFDKLGNKIKVFDSLIQAAKYIASDNDELDSLSATIASAAKNSNYGVKNKYLFAYGDVQSIVYTGSRNFPIIQLKSDGTKTIWNSISEAAKELNIKKLGILRVIKKERKSYKGSIWSDARLKQGELLENPTAK